MVSILFFSYPITGKIFLLFLLLLFFFFIKLNFFFRIMDESPRWLWAQGRVHEAVSIVERAAKVNGQPAPDTAFFVSRGVSGQRTKAEVAENANEGSAGLLDLVRTPSLRAKTLNCCLNWFANSLVYYGLSLNTGKLLGNPFLMLFIVGLVEWPSYVATILLMDRTGRRPLISTLMLLGGLACLLAVYIPQGSFLISLMHALACFALSSNNFWFVIFLFNISFLKFYFTNAACALFNIFIFSFSKLFMVHDDWT